MELMNVTLGLIVMGMILGILDLVLYIGVTLGMVVERKMSIKYVNILYTINLIFTLLGFIFIPYMVNQGVGFIIVSIIILSVLSILAVIIMISIISNTILYNDEFLDLLFKVYTGVSILGVLLFVPVILVIVL
ncbi:hypothetical protein LCFBJUUZ_CDS0138 [Staphylococcus phage PG-2021_76]